MMQVYPRRTEEQMTGPSLTQEQVNALPDNTRVMVKWSGGNGPWEYFTRRFNGSVYARTETTGPQKLGFELEFVGNKRFHTKVWLIDDE